MASVDREVFIVDTMLRPRITGKQGTVIKNLVERFKVSIVLDSEAPGSIAIEGENRKEARAAIEALLEGPKAIGNEMQTSASTEARPSHTPSTTFETTHLFIKYRLQTTTVQLDEKSIKKWVNARLDTFAGKLGGVAIEVDVLVVNAAQKSFVLKVPISDSSIVQAAISTADHFNKQPCAPEIIATSPSLTAMAGPDRFVSISQFLSE